jgi:hypothetical protein
MKESVMLRRFIIAIATVAAFGISFSSTNASAAKLGGGDGHLHTSNPTFFNKHSLRHDRGGYGYFPYGAYGYLPYGGFVGANLSDYYTPDYSNYYIDPIGAFSTLHLLDPVIPPPPPLSCRHSQETKMVPSEDGGMREIRITRC